MQVKTEEERGREGVGECAGDLEVWKNVGHFMREVVVEIGRSIRVFSLPVRDGDWSVAITRVHQMALSGSDTPTSPSRLGWSERGVCEEIRGQGSALCFVAGQVILNP